MKIETYVFKENYTGLLEGGISKWIVEEEIENINKFCKLIINIEPYFDYGEIDINTTPLPRYTHIINVVSSKHIGKEYYCGSHCILVIFTKTNSFLTKEEIKEHIKRLGWENIAKNFDY